MSEQLRCRRCGRFVGRADLERGRSGLLADGRALCPRHIYRHPIFAESARRSAEVSNGYAGNTPANDFTVVFEYA